MGHREQFNSLGLHLSPDIAPISLLASCAHQAVYLLSTMEVSYFSQQPLTGLQFYLRTSWNAIWKTGHRLTQPQLDLGVIR